MANEWDGDERRDGSWHLDKRVPIAIIFVLVFQAVGWVWGASKLDSRVESIEAWITQNNTVAARLSVIEEGQRWIKATLSEIKNSVRRGGDN